MTDRKYMLPFGWYGGKFHHLDWLLPLLPEDADTFVDVFGGSGSVLLNRPRASVEVLNDLDGDLVTFFRVLREDRQSLLESIVLTPWSRKEHCQASQVPNGAEMSDLERARRFFVRTQQSIAGISQQYRPSNWSYSVKDAMWMERTARWRDYPSRRLVRVADRLLSVQIECDPALRILGRYDTPDTLFYCDPPYVHVTRTRQNRVVYGNEMSDDDHRELAEVLQGIKGRAAVSGYRSALYDDIYDGWYRTDAKPVVPGSARHGATSGLRQECLWTNYDPSEHARERLLPF